MEVAYDMQLQVSKFVKLQTPLTLGMVNIVMIIFASFHTIMIPAGGQERIEGDEEDHSGSCQK